MLLGRTLKKCELLQRSQVSPDNKKAPALWNASRNSFRREYHSARLWLGVPEESLTQVFEPFFRVEEARDEESVAGSVGVATKNS
jgi:hypothetical protein